MKTLTIFFVSQKRLLGDSDIEYSIAVHLGWDINDEGDIWIKQRKKSKKTF